MARRCRTGAAADCKSDSTTKRGVMSTRSMQVIDYGLTKLDDHYSWASGWVETQLADQRLRGSASVSSSQVERALAADDDIPASITDPTVSSRLAARQARKLQRKWNKPNGFEWCVPAYGLGHFLTTGSCAVSVVPHPRWKAVWSRSLQPGPAAS